VLVSPKYAGNVGAVARSMANFGLRDLWLVAPRCVIGREAAMLAVHGESVLATARTVSLLDEALADRTFVIGTTARSRSATEHASLAPEPALARLRGQAGALVFGPEDSGLDNAALDRCDVTVTIPTAPYASLNLAQAVALLAYLWFVGGAGHPPEPEHVPASTLPELGPAAGQGTALPQGPAAAPRREQLEAMLTQFQALALRCGYTDELRATSMMRHMRRVLTRAAATEEDVARLRGLWSQLHGALDRAADRRGDG